jgi:hypothetical protein
METEKLKSRIPGKFHHNGCYCPLDDVPGLIRDKGNVWRWATAEHSAEVVAEPDGTVRIALPVPEPPPAVAVEINGRLPGNLRFATRHSRAMLLADTLIDGHTHLRRTFEQFTAGLNSAVSGDSAPCPSEPLAPEQVAAAIKGIDWPGESVIELSNGWEFRPRVRGSAVTVNAAIGHAELRLFRPIVTDADKSVSRDSLCDQALRFNCQLKHARLAMSDGILFAEARLHTLQLTPFWLETAAWAVAVADRRTRDILAVLNESKDVSDWYAESFLNGQQWNRK